MTAISASPDGASPKQGPRGNHRVHERYHEAQAVDECCVLAVREQSRRMSQCTEQAVLSPMVSVLSGTESEYSSKKFGACNGVIEASTHTSSRDFGTRRKDARLSHIPIFYSTLS